MQERSRSPAPVAVPDRRVDEGRTEAGSLVSFTGVRCPNPKCRTKLAEALTGTLTILCRKCGQTATIVR
jgi:hypothetical protein